MDRDLPRVRLLGQGQASPPEGGMKSDQGLITMRRWDGSPSVLQPMGEAWYEEVEHEPSTERAGLYRVRLLQRTSSL